MNKQNIRLFLFFIIGLLSAFLVMYLIQNYKIEKKGKDFQNNEVVSNGNNSYHSNKKNNAENTSNSGNIEALTEENTVINFIKTNKNLPECYLTKSEARKQGWNPSKGNLCDVLPGKAIGGDKFSNREESLPTGKQYFEADVNYHCGNRQTDRIVFTKNGDVWLTKNHYKTFEKQ